MLGCSVGTGVKKSKSRSVGVGSVDVGSVDVGSVGFFFFLIFGARAGKFRFSINWRWRVETDQVRDRCGRIEPVTS